MQFNGSAINRASLNGGASPRLPLLWAGDAVLTVGVELAGRVRRTLFGLAAVELTGDLLGTAERFGLGEVGLALDLEIDPSGVRNGQGVVVIALKGDLFYSKTISGYGTAILEIDAAGYVGVIFGGGEAPLSFLDTELNLIRARLGEGSGSMALMSEIDASAIRQAGVSTGGAIGLAEILGGLDPSHVNDLGQRYINASGGADIRLTAADAGMLRQSLLGSADLEVLSTGSARAIRTSPPGSAIHSLDIALTPSVRRYGQGAAAVEIRTALAGEIFVRGDMQAVCRVQATGTGYAFRRSVGAGASIALKAGLDGLRATSGSGSAELVVDSVGSWQRSVSIAGRAVITLFAGSDAYLNPSAMDIDEQWFFRPAAARDFARPSMQRDFARTP